MLSIICVYNNKKVLENCLLKAIEKQKYKDVQLILIDNTDNKFKTMESAFNDSLSIANGNFIAFSHQDICFLNENVLNNIVSQIESIDCLGVAGVAGAPFSEKKPLTVSNILQGSKMEKAAKYECTSFFECQTVDECFFVVPKSVLNQYPFNGKMNWHLYAVDYCLKMHENGKKVGVIPTKGILHLSPGLSLNNSYLSALIDLFSMHPSIKTIYTTMGKWEKGYKLYMDFFIKNIKMKFKAK